MDYTIHGAELPSVDFTAAFGDDSLMLAVDATASSKDSVNLPAVFLTACSSAE